MRLFTKRIRSIGEIREAGYEPCSEDAAAKFRTLAIPMLQRGLLPIEGTDAKFFVPVWAARAVNDWPLSSMATSEDWDYELLKHVIRRTVREGDPDFATAACSVARLGGRSAVIAFLGLENTI